MAWPRSATGLLAAQANLAFLFAASEPGFWFDPSDMSTLFQDSAGTTPVTASGQPVGKILDKSGRGNHATQTVSAARPTYIVSGGKSGLQFDGVDDFLVTPTITPGTDVAQVFAGVLKTSDAASGVVIEQSTSTGGAVSAVALFADPSVGFKFRSRAASISESTGGPVAPTTQVLTGLGCISTNLSALRLNGVAATPGAVSQGTGNYLAYPVYIGMRGGASVALTGTIYQIAVRFGPTLATAQIANTEAFINGKTGAY